MSAKDYRLGMRLDPGEKERYQRLAEKAGCRTIPEFVQHAVRQYEEIHPEIEKLKQKLATVQAALETARLDEEKVAFAHEEILAQFRKTITEMGAKQDAIQLERDKLNLEEMQKSVNIYQEMIDRIFKNVMSEDVTDSPRSIFEVIGRRLKYWFTRKGKDTPR